MTDPVEQIRARAALVAGNPDVVKVQSVRDRAVLLEYVTELEVIIARVQEYAYMRNFYNQPMYISELLGIVGEPDELSAVVVGGEAALTETPETKTEPIVRVLRAGDSWYWVCSECDDRFSTLTSEDAARQGAASHEDSFHSPAAVPVPAETPETVVGDFPCCASRTTGETTE